MSGVSHSLRSVRKDKKTPKGVVKSRRAFRQAEGKLFNAGVHDKKKGRVLTHYVKTVMASPT